MPCQDPALIYNYSEVSNPLISHQIRIKIFLSLPYKQNRSLICWSALARALIIALAKLAGLSLFKLAYHFALLCLDSSLSPLRDVDSISFLETREFEFQSDDALLTSCTAKCLLSLASYCKPETKSAFWVRYCLVCKLIIICLFLPEKFYVLRPGTFAHLELSELKLKLFISSALQKKRDRGTQDVTYFT